MWLCFLVSLQNCKQKHFYKSNNNDPEKYFTEKEGKNGQEKSPTTKKPITKTEIARQLKQQKKLFPKIVSKKTTLSKDTKTVPRAAEFVKTGISGFDALLDQGIPQGTSVLVAGGTGTGKTIFCLQTMNYGATRGEKCFT